MKKVIVTLLISFISPFFVLAAFNDVQLSSGSTLQVTVGSSVLDLTVTDGNVQDFNIESGIIYFTLASGSSLTITSADRTTFNLNGQATTSFECNSSSSVLYISLPNGPDVSFSVTPNNVTCTTSASQGTAVSTPIQPVVQSEPTPAPVPEPTSAPIPTPPLALVVAAVPAAEVAEPSPVAQLVSPVFNKDLQVSNRGEEVRRLQELLAQDKELYPEGLVTGYYGSLTREAVRRFQLKNGVISSPAEQGNGRLGPKTRAKLKEVYGEGVPKPSDKASSAPPAAIQSLQEQIKALLEQVQALQAQLKARQGQY